MAFFTLVQAFSNGCSEDLNKTIGKVCTSLKQTKFQSFLVVKQYRKTHPNTSDRDRYDDLMYTIVENLKTDEITKYLKSDEYFTQLTNLLCSDEGYDIFQDNFKKGSFKNLTQQLNRFFNPKKDEDTLDDSYKLDEHTKPYAVNFDDLLRTSNLHMYSKTFDNKNNVENTAYMLYTKGIKFLSLFEAEKEEKEEKEVGISFWLTDKEMTDDYTKVSIDDIMLNLNKTTFILNPVHFVTLDTLKRDFMNLKADSEVRDTFMNHLLVLMTTTELHFYSATYKFNKDMNDLSENNLHNTITGFPASFDSYAKAVFTIFTFDGEVGDVKVNSYWISTKLHDDLLTKDDIDAFEWKELVVEEFTNDMLKNGNLGTSYLH